MLGREEKPELLTWGVAARSFDGQVSGDGYVLRSFPGGILVCVVDGLGHGPEAAAASRLAIEVMEAHASEDVVSLVRRCHRRLQRTRGAAVALASFGQAGAMTWVGVGSVDAVLLRADPDARPRREALLLPGGVVGYELPPLRSCTLDVHPGDTLVLATDGIRPGFAEGVRLGESPQRAAEAILERFGTGTDDALVVVVRHLGDGP
jgi:hypothetical protein